MAWNETERLKKRFQFICDVRWDDMDPTASSKVRNCSKCDKAVYATPTEADFNHHASLGHCVSAPTRHGSALVAKPEGPPERSPPLLAGAPRRPETSPVPIPVPIPEPETIPEPIKPQPIPDHGGGGMSVRSDEEPDDPQYIIGDPADLAG